MQREELELRLAPLQENLPSYRLRRKRRSWHGKLPPSLAFDGNDKKYWEELFGEEWSQVMVREVKGYKFILANFDQANPDATVGLDGYMAKY